MLNPPFFIIGFMAAGKTTAAKNASESFKLPYIDSDEAIEIKNNLSIGEIFKQKGEDKFRTIEKDWLLNNDFSNHIVSLGGGLPCYNGLMEKLLSTGVVIFLNTKWNTIEQRLKKDKERPLNQSLQDIKQLYKKRLPIYQKAHHIVNNEDEMIELISILIKKQPLS